MTFRPTWPCPTGRAAVDYTEAPPLASAKAQAFYGMATTPALAGGRIPLRLALLSPAGRPIAVTADLGGFWKGAWADARRDMRGRYPKHRWPEDGANPARKLITNRSRGFLVTAAAHAMCFLMCAGHPENNPSSCQPTHRLIRPNAAVLAAVLPQSCAEPGAAGRRLLTADASARAAPESLAPLVKKVLPAVVNIAVTETVSGGDMLSELPPELRDTPLGREFRRRFGNRREQVAGAGSGFIIDPSGIIVTNNHVVDHADKIVVSLTDGRQLPAKVHRPRRTDRRRGDQGEEQ